MRQAQGMLWRTSRFLLSRCARVRMTSLDGTIGVRGEKWGGVGVCCGPMNLGPPEAEGGCPHMCLGTLTADSSCLAALARRNDKPSLAARASE
jgi:hypothetical protein